MANILTTIRPLDHLKNSESELFKYVDLVKLAGQKTINFNFKFFDKIDSSTAKWENLCKDLQNYLQKVEIHVPITHSYYDNLIDFANLDTAENLKQKTIKSLALSKNLGAHTMVIHAGIFNAQDYDEKQTIEKNVAFYLPICKLAQVANIRIAFENHVNAVSPSNDKALEPSIDTINRIVNQINQALGSKTAGICFDCAHANISGYNVYDELLKCKDNLFTLHLHNNYGNTNSGNIWTNDLHNPILKGDIDISRITQILNSIGFKDDIVIESVYKGTPQQIITGITEDNNYLASLINCPRQESISDFQM